MGTREINVINDINRLMGYIDNTIKSNKDNKITYEKYSKIFDYKGNKDYYKAMNYKDRWSRVIELEKVTVMFE